MSTSGIAGERPPSDFTKNPPILLWDYTTSARFEHGFKLIMGERLEHELPFGWDPRRVAEVIRNMLDHGLDLDRKQTKNDQNNVKVEVESMGFIPHDAATKQKQVLFDIYKVGEERYVLLVSPMLYWRYVQEWYEHRIK